MDVLQSNYDEMWPVLGCVVKRNSKRMAQKLRIKNFSTLKLCGAKHRCVSDKL